MLSVTEDRVKSELMLEIVSRFLRDLRCLVKERMRLVGRRGFLELMRKGLICSRLVGLRLCMARLYREQLRLR